VTRATPQSNSVWKDGFLFLANHLALDFINTRPVQDGEAMELLPDFTALLRWFRAAELLRDSEVEQLKRRRGDSIPARRALHAVLALRERLRNEVVTWEAGSPVHLSTVDELNRLMSKHPMRARIKATLNGLSRELWFETEQPGDLLAPLAQAAASLFTEVSRDRVRKCGQCVLHYRDTSKKGTRLWCSMQFCGNRRKVAAYAARRRTS
jgi:predicted RNA-binding Zn ribbon-like protein